MNGGNHLKQYPASSKSLKTLRLLSIGIPRRADHEVRSSQPAWPICETPSLLNIQKLAGCGGIHIIPATREAEAGELLEPGRWRLQ